ncbi:MAG TPA: DMT family transporter [Anaeromyxobacter sp.]|nr:DMT family transporter [Anaeromyxobacter sp.]
MAGPGEQASADRPFGAAAAAPVHARARARALLFGAGVLFGLSAVLARVATLAGMSGGQVTLARFGLGLAFVAGLFAARPGTFRPRRKGLLVSRGLFGGFAALLYFLAIARIPAGEATLLNNTFPIFAVVISLFVLNERPTVHLSIALLLASAGVFLVLGGGSVGFALGTGELLGIASAITGGAAVTSIRALRATDNAPTIFFAFAVGGFLVSIPFALGPWPSAWAPYVATLGVAIVAFVAQLFMTEAYGALSVPEAAIWQQLTPIASYLWALTLGEPVGWTTVIGVLLGVAGVAYGTVLGHAPRDASAPQARMAEGIPAEEP